MAVSGASGSDQSWMPLRSLTRGIVAGLTGAAAAAAAAGAAGRVRTAHPESGALIDPENELASQAYRPSQRLQALIRQRDGRCRFPGCAVAARQCDIDHVRPWPKGPTAASNLMCLCRRHHRIKQLHRWRVRIFTDGTVEWTDPAGQTLTTRPIDHLGATHPRRSSVTTTHMPTTTPIDYDAALAYEREHLDLATSRGEVRFGIGLEHEIANAAEWAHLPAQRSTRALRRQQAKRSVPHPAPRPPAPQTRQRTPQWTRRWTRKVERAGGSGRCRYELYSPPANQHILVEFDDGELAGAAGSGRPSGALRGYGTMPGYDDPPF